MVVDRVGDLLVVGEGGPLVGDPRVPDRPVGVEQEHGGTVLGHARHPVEFVLDAVRCGDARVGVGKQPGVLGALLEEILVLVRRRRRNADQGDVIGEAMVVDRVPHVRRRERAVHRVEDEQGRPLGHDRRQRRVRPELRADERPGELGCDVAGSGVVARREVRDLESQIHQAALPSP